MGEAPPERAGCSHTILFTRFRAPPTPSKEAPPERGGYSHTILFTRFRAPPTPPGRPRQSEEGIRKPYYLLGFVPLPPLQGGPARARRVFATHTIYTVSCPSHSSREAPPERGGYSQPILLTRFRAPPTPPGRPRQSEEGIRNPY